jgi:hypothetical protein
MKPTAIDLFLAIVLCLSVVAMGYCILASVPVRVLKCN